MSNRSRYLKADARRHERYRAMREQLRANQASLATQDPDDIRTELERAVAAIFDAALRFCDPEAAARHWVTHHPDPMPAAHGYYRKHRSRR